MGNVWHFLKLVDGLVDHHKVSRQFLQLLPHMGIPRDTWTNVDAQTPCKVQLNEQGLGHWPSYKPPLDSEALLRRTAMTTGGSMSVSFPYPSMATCLDLHYWTNRM